MSARTAAVDVVTLSGRSVRRGVREVDTLLLSIALPVLLMLVFAGVLGGALGGAVEGGYVDYVVPGVVLICAAYGAAQTAVAVAADRSEGLIDRLRTMDVLPTAVLWGHLVASLARNAVATVAVVGVALLLGFRPVAGPLEWLAAAGVLALFVLALSCVSVALGLVAGGPEAASGFTFGVLFLPYVSSAFVPTDTMPAVLHGFAEHQPVTPVIETLRALLLGTTYDGVWLAVAWSVGLGVLGTLASVLAHRRVRGSR